ncbi:PAS domain-containing protein [Billgrantia azerbaijanica]|nr:PAS domain-containing protein [Halomonas azerbaijanica]
MRNNQPVTQGEYHLHDDDLLVSRTDLEGRITYANSDFIRVSGFDWDELVGSPHNLVRHPDMPPEVFEDLWATLQGGESWQGVLKNRCKNGDFYWVQSTVTPILEEGECLGYTSVRVKADPAAVERAERQYARLRNGKGHGLTVRGGRVTRRGLAGWWTRLNLGTIRAKLVMMTLVPLLLLAISSGVGLYGVKVSGERVNALNRDGLQDVIRLQQIDQLVSEGHRRVGSQDRMAILSARTEHAEALDESIERLRELWRDYRARDVNATPLADTFDAALSAYLEGGLASMRDALASEDSLDTFTALNNDVGPLREQGVELSGIVNQLIEQKRQAALDMSAAAEQGQRQMLIGQAAFLALGLIVLIALGAWIMAAINRPLRRAVDVALQIAAGNLAIAVPQRKHDEVGRLLDALGIMRRSLYNTTLSVKRGVDVVMPASQTIATGNEALASRTEQQAASLQQTASSMEEMTTTVQQNSDNARQASTLATDNASRMRDTGELMHGVVKSMERITASSQKMKDIINVIDGIAFQTNILALNASVEAARAGEQGRGFAVVAGEVRSLAGRSADAAKEIRELIDGTNTEIEGGATRVQQAESAMAEVVETSNRVNDIIGEITAASTEQSNGIGQINQAITELDQVTQQNAARVQESARSAGELQTQVASLARDMQVYRMRGLGPERVTSPSREAPRESAGGSRGNRGRRVQGDPLPEKRQPGPARADRAAEEEWETF